VKEGAIVDNTVLSNFVLIEREDILSKVLKNNFFVTEEVLEELKRGVDID
jgi:predicted nucleic acid-binding protein